MHFAAAPYVLGGIFIAMALAVFVFRVERSPATTEGAEAGPAQQSRIRLDPRILFNQLVDIRFDVLYSTHKLIT
ncbi:hypothetical protein [Aminobacter sp. MET-1]|uniref:hypothetical protein n=1 Tax=Aminobacter sp. MET-1 TaxID=2951085 RepID=UPI00226A7C30|nr:hypothetical protein [Aminobacter sp. MET-1]MCX8568510.1 hypothetical protein [Aminobacter sp. MET-1]